MTVGKWLTCLVLASTLGVSPAPQGRAFYSPPSPLPQGKPGDVVWYRDLHGGAVLPSAAQNYLVLYHTISATGQDVAVSGTLAIPRGQAPTGGWPIVSWAHGTTGDAFECTPSLNIEPNSEGRLLDRLVAQGYAVAQTDYEGQGTPGIHPYFVAVASAHDTIDIVRAARQIDPEIGTQWIAMGHSEGGTAALSAAALGPAWAPELHLVGVVAYAPGSHILSFLNAIVDAKSPSYDLVTAALMVQGIASADPSIDLSNLLSRGGQALMPQLQRRCVHELLDDEEWNTFAPSAFFRPGVDLTRLRDDFAANDPKTLHIKVPVLILQGTADVNVEHYRSDELAASLCDNGANVTYDIRAAEDHFTVLSQSLPEIQQWLAARFAGASPGAGSCL